LKSWSSLSVKLTAFGRYPQAVQYSIETAMSFAMLNLLTTLIRSTTDRNT
jgi:hypothetical protein